MSVVESEIAPEDTGPSTPEEWYEANLEATLHTIVENMVLRSESEKVVLHALIDGLDENPDDVIAKLEVAPINQGGGGYVDPVTAQILADNASLRNDVRELLDALKAQGQTNSPAIDHARTDINESVTTPPAQVQQNTPENQPVAPIQTAPVPVPVEPNGTQETPAAQNTPGAETAISSTPEAPANAPVPAPVTGTENQ